MEVWACTKGRLVHPHWSLVLPYGFMEVALPGNKQKEVWGHRALVLCVSKEVWGHRALVPCVSNGSSSGFSYYAAVKKSEYNWMPKLAILQRNISKKNLVRNLLTPQEISRHHFTSEFQPSTSNLQLRYLGIAETLVSSTCQHFKKSFKQVNVSKANEIQHSTN